MDVEDSLNDPSEGAPEVLWEPGRPLPAFAKLDGVDVVLITLADYRELQALRSGKMRAAMTDVV